MRISPDYTPDILAALANARQQEQEALEEISSGRRVSAPSDDPAAFAAYVQNRARAAENDQFLYSNSSAQALLQAGDSTLSSVVSNLQRAITLGTQGATGTISQSQRDAITTELRGIQQSLVTLANTSFRGSPIFAGTSSSTPFSLDSSTGDVEYLGNSTVNQALIADGRTLATNMSGNDLFLHDGASVFGAIGQLIDSLANGAATDEIGDATSAVRTAFDHITAQRSFYGNAINQLDAGETYLNTSKLQLATEEDNLVGAKEEESVTRFVNAETARNETLAAMAKLSNLSLLDYLN
jgi:flagellar hook-associated protein 3 FlgL